MTSWRALAGIAFLVAGPMLRADESLPVPVRVVHISRDEIAAGKTFIGTVEAARRGTVGSPVAGQVESVFAEEGDLVDPKAKANDKERGAGLLIQLRRRTAELQLASAKADRDAMQHQLDELKAGPRVEEKRRLEAEAKGAEALRDYATDNFDRLAGLFNKDATAKGNLEQALSARVAAEQRYLAAQAEHEAAINGSRPEQLLRAEAQLRKAQEDVNRLQDELDNHTIQTPFRGYVVKRYTEKGAWIQVGDPVADILELDHVEVRVSVPEESITRVAQGDRVRVDVAAVRAERSHFDGRVFRVIPNADSRSRSFPVRVRVANPTLRDVPLLKPGMLARVTLAVGPKIEAWLVPEDALVYERADASIFVIAETGRHQVTEIDVEVGATLNDMVQVTAINATLSAEMRVVYDGNERLANGQLVSVLKD